MKKAMLLKIFLILLPAMAVLLATTGDSVIVFDTAAKTTESYSYFSLIPQGTLKVCTPLAALLAVAATVLAVAFVVTGKRLCLGGVIGTGFASAVAATAPILMQGDVVVVPNAFFPILVLADCVLAYYMMKKTAEKTQEKPAIRLGDR